MKQRARAARERPRRGATLFTAVQVRGVLYYIIVKRGRVVAQARKRPATTCRVRNAVLRNLQPLNPVAHNATMPTDTPRKSPRLQDMHLDISPGQRRAKGSTGSATSAGSDRYTRSTACST